MARIGYDAVEICLEGSQVLTTGPGPEMLSNVRTWLNDTGLQIASVSYHGDADPLKHRIENTFTAIEIARQLPASIVVMNSERKIPGQEEKQFSDLISRCQDFAAAAEQAGVFLALEPEPGTVIHGTAEMLRLLEAVNSPRLKVNLDIGHAYITDPDLATSIRQLGDAIVHTHIEDIADKVHKHLLPGTGEMDLPKVMRTFLETGYDGYFVFDLFGLGTRYEQYARQAYEYMQDIRDL